MRQWQRAIGTRRCGRCGGEVRAGDPIVVYEVAVGRAVKLVKLIRCATCEGGAPPDLPLVIEFDHTPKPAIDLTRLGLLPLDFKLAAAGDELTGEDLEFIDARKDAIVVEREPGEEG